MNCSRCNAPLIPEARFCRNCGMPVSVAIPQPSSGYNEQANQQGIHDSPTVLPLSWQAQAPAAVESAYTPPQAYQPTVAVSPSPGSMPSSGTPYAAPAQPKGRRKNRLVQGLLILFATLLILLLLLVAGWFVVLRPPLHGVAQNEIDRVFASAAFQINPAEALLLSRSHTPVVITETDSNNFIATNNSQSSPIQQIHMTITPTGLQMDFQAYGFTSTVTGVPQVVNGQLTMTNVSVQGIAALIMSPEELTTTLNAHLQSMNASLHVANVVLKSHEMDIRLR